MAEVAEPATTNEEARLRELAEAWARAIEEKDIEAAVRHHAVDMVLFDVMAPLQLHGLDAYRQRLQQWFVSTRGPIVFERVEMRVAASGDVGWCHAVNRIACKGLDGSEHDDLVRATVCFRKVDGEWRVTHEHASVPLTMPS